MSIFATLGSILNTAFILYCLALGIWAGSVAMRNETLPGGFFGAMWLATGLAVAGLLVWLGRQLSGEELRSVYLLYELFFIVVLPGTFALLRGRDDRNAAVIFAGIAIFTALAAISAADPTRHVVAPNTSGPSPSVIVTTTPVTQ